MVAGLRWLSARADGWSPNWKSQALGTYILPVKSKNPLTIWQNADRLARVIQDNNVQLVHARSRAPAWSALWAARHTNIPFVTTYHGFYNQKTRLKAFYNSVMARGDKVIANSHYTANLIAERHPDSKSRIVTVLSLIHI